MEKYTLADKLQAVFCRLRVVPRKEKIRICLKLCLRLIGIRKCLYLGGYLKKEDAKQAMQDEAIVECFRRKGYEDFIPFQKMPSRCVSELPAQDDIVRKIRKLIQDKGSYIAFVVENLDQGGLEKVVQMLAVCCKKSGICMKVLCIQGGGRIADYLQDQLGIAVVCFDGDCNSLRCYLQDCRPLVANTHYVGEAMEEFFALGIPVIEVIHNMYVFLSEAGIDMERRKRDWVNKYIAVSEASAEIFRKKVFIGSVGEVVVIPNAVEKRLREDDYGRVGAVVRKRMDISEDAVVYLAAGSIDARKNQIGLLRAWDIAQQSGMSNSILIVAGESTDVEYERKVKALVKERGLEQNVVFTGFCKEIDELMDAADVFVMASYYEGCSLAAIEALQSGLVLIHTDCGSGAELTAGGKNGLLIENPLGNIDSYDSIRLYDAIHAGINENIGQLAASLMKVQDSIGQWRLTRTERKAYGMHYASVDRMLEQYLELFLEVGIPER